MGEGKNHCSSSESPMLCKWCILTYEAIPYTRGTANLNPCHLIIEKRTRSKSGNTLAIDNTWLSHTKAHMSIIQMHENWKSYRSVTAPNQNALYSALLCI